MEVARGYERTLNTSQGELFDGFCVVLLTCHKVHPSRTSHSNCKQYSTEHVPEWLRIFQSDFPALFERLFNFLLVIFIHFSKYWRNLIWFADLLFSRQGISFFNVICWNFGFGISEVILERVYRYHALRRLSFQGCT